MNDRMQKQIDSLKFTKQGYINYVLCNKEDPYKVLMQNNLKAIVGLTDSNLIVQVRIKNSGKEALRYRHIANKIVFQDFILQKHILQNFLNQYKKIEFFKNKNPLLTCHDGTIEKTVWHHSPNHILTVSLIPERIHLKYKRYLHINGKKGGNSMFTVK